MAFFGFFGALKKGDFFGVHPKKSQFDSLRPETVRTAKISARVEKY
jgi:hypothetical protein